MGLIGKQKSFVRNTRNSGAKVSDVKFDSSDKEILTGEHFSSPGDDSHPLDNDYLVAVRVRGEGNVVIFGYADTVNDKKSSPGEVRKYARDSGTGLEVNEVHLKNDGSITINNAGGSVVLQPSGEITVNANTSVNVIAPTAEITATDAIVNADTVDVNADDVDIDANATVKITSPLVELGDNTAIPLVNNIHLITYNTHTHPGGASNPPSPQATVADQTIFTKGS